MLVPEKVESKRSLIKSVGSGVGIGSAIIGSALVASADETTIGYSTWSSIITAAQAQLNVTSIVGVLAGTITACVGLVFMWWGVRKGVRMLMSAFKKGKLRV